MADAAQVQVFAIIPAAGQATRMGRPKQLLPVGEATMLECVIEAVLHGDIDGLCVVTSSAIDRALLLSEDPRFIVAVNAAADSDMLDSIRMGMAALNGRRPVADIDGYAVCPGDMPHISADDVCAVTRAYRDGPGSIVVAAHGGARGHPMVFPALLAPEVRAIDAGGLNMLVERHADRVRLIERESRGVIQDVDTPEDWRLTIGDP